MATASSFFEPQGWSGKSLVRWNVPPGFETLKAASEIGFQGGLGIREIKGDLLLGR